MSVVRAGDRVFAGVSRSAGIAILVILAGVAFFLTIEAIDGITASPDDVHGLPAGGFWSYVGPLVFGTLWAAAIALVIATPLAIALALFITMYAPRRVGGPIGYVVDLLAAVPSVVFGLWGIAFLAPNLVPIYQWLSANLGFIPMFATSGTETSWGDMTWPGRVVLITILALAVALVVACLSKGGKQFKANRIAGVVTFVAAFIGVIAVLWSLSTAAPGVFPFNDWFSSIYGWFSDRLFFLPDISDGGGDYSLSATGRTVMTAAIVLAIMILPIITAICREIFLQTPRLHIEASLALGATRWEMIRQAVIPYARSGIVGATMLGLGRALGETMAVAMVLSASGVISVRLLSSTNPSTIPANIAQQYPEARGDMVSVLIATGLVLFVITFVVNFAARWVVNRRAEFSGAN